MLIETIKNYCNASWIKEYNNIDIDEWAIDTRKISQPEHAIFIAIKARRDGHLFIKDAYDKGIRNFLVSEEMNYNEFTEANFLLVKDTLAALQLIAFKHRSTLHYPTIGITGSNGKTIVKELLYQILSELPQYQLGNGVVHSPKSYNSQIGVALSVLEMKPDNTLAILEAGISQPDEMEKLEKIIHPTIGIFTNIGDAHSEGFLNVRQKINEKLKLFTSAKNLIYRKDYYDMNEAINLFNKNINPDLKLFTWSMNGAATLAIRHIEKQNNYSTITALYTDVHNENLQSELSISIPYSDDAYIENAIHCWCTLLLLQIPNEVIKEKMGLLQSVAMRLELRQGDNNCTIINDTYNSDITSLKIALSFLAQQRQHSHKTIIISDMFQAGKPDYELYNEIAEMVNNYSIQRIICIGPALSKHKTAFRKYKNIRSIYFKTTAQFLQKIHLITFANEVILLKGARAFSFEKIEKILEQKIHKTILEINLSSLSHNLNVYRKMLHKEVKLMAMVKAFSYGNGSYEIANTLQFEGVDYLAVAYTDEGVALRKAGITLPIMVMSPEPDSFDRMISWKLEPEIFNIQSLHHFLSIAKTLNVHNYPIHIKLDTGMHRLGFTQESIGQLCIELNNSDKVKVASIFSHLAGSDTALLDEFTKKQAENFDKMSQEIMKHLDYRPILHLSNTAAISRHSALQYDMVRLGIGLYGFDASTQVQEKLLHIGTLKTIIAQIKKLQPGETVGYSRNGKVIHASTIATVAIGYADGYFRSFGNGLGYMLVNGKKAPLIGNVCMDMCMIDITHIPNVQEGNEVIVFGKELPVSTLAQWGQTIPYEVMTAISQRVKRVYIND